MPVLDLELWVENNVIYHSFYKKKVSSQYTILKRSALSYSIKKNTMLQEALRRLGNISSGLPKEETTKVMTKYSNMLRISGYTERERLNFINDESRRNVLTFQINSNSHRREEKKNENLLLRGSMFT